MEDFSKNMIHDRRQKVWDSYKKRNNIIQPDDVQLLTNVNSYIKDEVLYIIPDGDCAGFQMNIYGDCFIEPREEYLNNNYKFALKNNILLAFSWQYNLKFSGAVLNIKGNVKIKNAIFTGRQNESISTRVRNIRTTNSCSKHKEIVTKDTTPVKYLTPNSTPKYTQKQVLKQGVHYFEWKSKLLNDV